MDYPAITKPTERLPETSPNCLGSPRGPSEQRGAKTTLDGYILIGQMNSNLHETT